MAQRSIAQQLEHDLACAIETGNLSEVQLVVAQAESAYEAKQISCMVLADIVWDSITAKEALC